MVMETNMYFARELMKRYSTGKSTQNFLITEMLRDQ